MSEHVLTRRSYDELAPDIPKYLEKILLEHDFDAERRLREMGREREIKFISCRGLVKNETLMDQMRRMLRCIQDEYEYPVDTEFTINLSENGEYSVDLLQCRPLQVQKGKEGTTVPTDIPADRIFLESRGSSMGISKASSLDLVVWVDPIRYYNMPYKDKILVARLIGKINWKYRDSGKHMMLIVPGRVGTTSPELGVPTAFSDISAFEIICETEESKAGYNPELSYGSHIFQDLVEAEILYTAVFHDGKTVHYHPEMLEAFPDIVAELDPAPEVTDIVHVYDVSGGGCDVYIDVAEEHLLISCTGK